MNLPVVVRRFALVALGALRAGPVLAAPVAPRVAVTLSFIEPSGRTLAEKRIDAILGSETPTDVKDKNRTITVKTTVRVAAKPDCYLAEIAVRDQDIDPSGHFSKKEWQTRGEVCDGFYITLGPRDETRVRIAVQRPK
jgi:hypothetical protein